MLSRILVLALVALPHAAVGESLRLHRDSIAVASVSADEATSSESLSARYDRELATSVESLSARYDRARGSVLNFVGRARQDAFAVASRAFTFVAGPVFEFAVDARHHASTIKRKGLSFIGIEQSQNPSHLITTTPLPQREAPSNQHVERCIFQLVLGVIYYFWIVAKYPKMVEGSKATEDAIKLQQAKLTVSEKIMATFQVSVPNCLLSCFCISARAAHTFDAAGIMNYWVGLIAMACCSPCTLCYVSWQTDLNEKLGGEKEDCLGGCLTGFCCGVCVVAQDAESIDMITGETWPVAGRAQQM